MKTSLRIFLSGILFLSILQAKIIHVPADQPSIQAGINNAVNGDTVLVAQGTFVENLDFKGKNIVVGSLFLITGDTSYISQTVIDGNNYSTVVTFKSRENNSALLTGFSVTHGKGKDQAPTGAWPYDYIGGGITCRDSSNPRLVGLRIFENTAPYGAGVCIRQANPVLENVIILQNTSSHTGGGIYCYYYSSPILKNVIIQKNTSVFWGGGVACLLNSSSTFQNCFIAENISNEGGGIYCFEQSNASLENTTITKNIAYERGGGFYGDQGSMICDRSRRSNIYLNYSAIGSDVCTNTALTVIVDTFTVVAHSSDFAYPMKAFVFDILHGKITQVSHDLYVDPSGSDDNSGQSSLDPLHSISFALTKIMADSLMPHTIHIANGTYKPSSGDHFPLSVKSYVSLSGESVSKTILDAER